MSAGRDRFDLPALRGRRGGRTGRPGSLWLKVLALAFAATVAILLWQFAIRAGSYALAHAGPRPSQAATVVTCDRAPGPDSGCSVTIREADGNSRELALTNPGLFSMQAGDEVPVVRLDDGTAGLGGWRPVGDAGLLTVLAAAFTSYAIGWWRRVLEHGDPLYDGGELPGE